MAAAHESGWITVDPAATPFLQVYKLESQVGRERGKGRCSLCRDTDCPISPVPLFVPVLLFDETTFKRFQLDLPFLSSGKHISYVYLINRKLARASKNFGFLSKATRINSGRNSSTDAEERINFLRDGTRWNPFCANERTTLVSISSRESKASRGSQLVHRFDSIRLSDGWKRHKRGHHRFGQTFDPISFPWDGSRNHRRESMRVPVKV